jgi:hypothetical protein
VQVLGLRWSNPFHFSQLSQLLLAGISRLAHIIVGCQHIPVRFAHAADAYRSVTLDTLKRECFRTIPIKRSWR